jgi:hypothetical protein
MNGAIYVENSRNSKLSSNEKIDSVYASVKATCPLTCHLRDKGCYCQMGNTGIHVNRLDREAENLSVLDVARAEAHAIDNSYKGGQVPSGRNCRLHVSGDCRTITGARIINSAIGRWKKRQGNIMFSYTRAWDHVTRDMWSNVSMLASVDSIEDAVYARQNGYAPTLVVSEHISNKAYYLTGSDIKWIPCVAQTNHGTCASCKLCMNADRLFDNNMGITFAAHGVKKNFLKKQLTVIK